MSLGQEETGWIAVVGSINMDLVASVERIPAAGETVRGWDFQTHPGGKGANQAVAAARLGGRVRMLGKVGRDAAGELLLARLQDAGVDLACVAREDGPTGVALISVQPEGENSIVVVPGANAALTPEFVDAHRETVLGAAMVLVQLEVPIATVEHLAVLCGQHGVPLVLDPAPAQRLPEEVFRHLLWFTPNETEAAFYLGEQTITDAEQAARRLLSLGMKGVALKLGARGVVLATQDGTMERLPAFEVEAVDTTAAGDTWNGGFAVGLTSGWSVKEAGRFAAAAAAISVTRRGAQPSMPTREEVERLLQRQGHLPL
jgi:ribokinase